MGILEKLKSSCCTCGGDNALIAADDDFGAYERRNTDLSAVSRSATKTRGGRREHFKLDRRGNVTGLTSEYKELLSKSHSINKSARSTVSGAFSQVPDAQKGQGGGILTLLDLLAHLLQPTMLRIAYLVKKRTSGALILTRQKSAPLPSARLSSDFTRAQSVGGISVKVWAKVFDAEYGAYHNSNGEESENLYVTSSKLSSVTTSPHSSRQGFSLFS